MLSTTAARPHLAHQRPAESGSAAGDCDASSRRRPGPNFHIHTHRIESFQESSRRCPIRWRKVTQMDKPERIAAHLARNLVGLRHARGLTQEALAKSSGLPRSTIANLESGEGNPSLAVLVKVASRLGVPIDELLASARAKVRQWAAVDVPTQTQGRGVTLRPLVTEPVPEEMLTLMAFAPRG